jgi:hypothetical protein
MLKSRAMTETLPIHRAEPKKKVDKRERISGRLRHALDLMVWGDESGKIIEWDVAGRTVNISARSMRRSLERYAVRQYLQEQKQVLRACISAKSLWRLDEIAAQRSNMNAAVNAIKAIDGDEAATARQDAVVPGVTIRVVNVLQAPAADGGRLIEVAPAKPEPAPALESGDPIFRIP